VYGHCRPLAVGQFRWWTVFWSLCSGGGRPSWVVLPLLAQAWMRQRPVLSAVSAWHLVDKFVQQQQQLELASYLSHCSADMRCMHVQSRVALLAHSLHC
jgi:hypothetical protein